MLKENGAFFTVESDKSVFNRKVNNPGISADSIFALTVRSVGILTALLVFLFFILMIYQGLRVFEFLSPSELLSAPGEETVFSSGIRFLKTRDFQLCP